MDLGDVFFGFFLGISITIGVLTWLIAQDDTTTVRRTFGEFLKEAGEAIVKNAPNKNPKI